MLYDLESMHVLSFCKYFLSHNLHSDMLHKFNSLSWTASAHNTDIFLKSVLVYTAGSLHFLWREVLNGLNSTCSLNYRQSLSHPLQHFWEKLYIYISSRVLQCLTIGLCMFVKKICIFSTSSKHCYVFQHSETFFTFLLKKDWNI